VCGDEVLIVLGLAEWLCAMQTLSRFVLLGHVVHQRALRKNVIAEVALLKVVHLSSMPAEADLGLPGSA